MAGAASGAAAAYERQLEEALAFMRAGERFLVVSHVQPDGDAISSTVVADWMLRRLGKETVLLSESAIPAKLGFLRTANTIVNYRQQPPAEKFDRIVAVDCADFRRIGLPSELFAEGAQLLNIDHHPTNDSFGAVNVIRTDAAATVEILYDLIDHAGLTPDPEAAAAIYTGLITDTGGFRYSNTSPRVMEVASRMLALGAPGHWIADHLLERMTKPQLLLLKKGLSRLAFSADNRVAWLHIDHADMADTAAAPDDLEGLVNYARNVEGVEVGILFKETSDGEVKVSMRSAGKADVAAIAQSFGGGGHVRAAGCRLEGPIPEAIERVVGAVSEALGR
ncbi:DHH family phosphoesterase [Paenibacillus humicola]|uniref:DHH family phosphoesterase n=1 Tax=Paenibacillus humicola TaxID=3110540 RepID=UPI00237B7F56|nr:bifunctional oligoribonuclease/PAP phosphatase NrnA [Paenibacillus humicola]